MCLSPPSVPAGSVPLITEADAARACPQQGFLFQYVLHAMKQTTSPLAYHLGVGLSILAATCPSTYGMRYAGTLRPNMYTLLVGRSGEDQKSSALGIGKEVLFEAAAALVGDFPGSAEGLIESLDRQNTQLIPVSEFGKLLAAAQRGYFEPIKTLLTDAWDCTPQQRAKANNKIIRVDNPRLSVMGGCSVPYLEKHTLAEDWTGGFMGRWFVIHAQRERVDPDPVGDDSMKPWLVDELKRRAYTPAAGDVLGLTPAAKQLWADWFTEVSNRQLPGNIVGIRARAPTIARKIAMLLGWDYGGAIAGQPWHMDVDVLVPAIAITELHIRSLVDLAEVIAEHPDARARRSVLDAIRIVGGEATLGQILTVMKSKRRPVMESLDAIMEEGRVVRYDTALGPVYRII